MPSFAESTSNPARRAIRSSSFRIARSSSTTSNRPFFSICTETNANKVSIARLARQQTLAIQCFSARVRAGREPRAFVHRGAGVLTFGVERVEAEVEIRQAAAVEQALLDRVRLEALERVEGRVFGMHAATHVHHDGKRAEVVEV